MTDILYKDESFKIIGICMEIHKTLGICLKEINYKDALEIEFIDNKIPYERERQYKVLYKNKVLGHPYLADFIVYEAIILEIKSVTAIIDTHIAQTLSYLQVSAAKLGIIVNFGERLLTWKRVLL